MCRRPAVSTSTTSVPRAVAAPRASYATAAGSPARPPPHEPGPRPFRPPFQLPGRARPVGVGRGHDHASPLPRQTVRDLPHGGRLPDPVDTDHQVHGRRRRGHGKSPFSVTLEDRPDRVGQDPAQPLLVPHPTPPHSRLDRLDEAQARLDSEVGSDEALLEVLARVGADLAHGTGNRPGEGTTPETGAVHRSPEHRRPTHSQQSAARMKR